MIKALCLLFLVATPVFTAWTLPTANCTATDASTTTHYGGCLLKTALQVAPNDLRFVGNPTSSTSSCIAPFKYYMMVNGLLLVGSANNGTAAAQTTSEAQIKWVAKAVAEMLQYDAASTCDGYNQCLVMQKMYEYRGVASIINPNLSGVEKIEGNWSKCDILMLGVSSNQHNEIIEHLLHFISDVGLSRAMPNVFGFGDTSLLVVAMNEAITAKMYVTTNYSSVTPAEQKHRIMVQEYFYQLFATCSTFFKNYTGHNSSEWVLTT